MATVEPDVDADGNIETPAGQAAEKKKNKNLTIAAIVIGGLGVAVTIYAKKKNAAAGAASSGGGYSYPSGAPGGATADTSGYGTLADAFSSGNQALQQQIDAQTQFNQNEASAVNQALSTIVTQNQAIGTYELGIGKQNQAIGTMLQQNGFHPVSASGAKP